MGAATGLGAGLTTMGKGVGVTDGPALAGPIGAGPGGPLALPRPLSEATRAPGGRRYQDVIGSK